MTSRSSSAVGGYFSCVLLDDIDSVRCVDCGEEWTLPHDIRPCCGPCPACGSSETSHRQDELECPEDA